ncbi:hypothetical protein B0H13DRAFT_2393296 [Mycena leptocephala]|nr:hypothetical protein B0H13DRAFT_2393296 [Mycena leptocephala]
MQVPPDRLRHSAALLRLPTRPESASASARRTTTTRLQLHSLGLHPIHGFAAHCTLCRHRSPRCRFARAALLVHAGISMGHEPGLTRPHPIPLSLGSTQYLPAKPWTKILVVQQTAHNLGCKAFNAGRFSSASPQDISTVARRIRTTIPRGTPCQLSAQVLDVTVFPLMLSHPHLRASPGSASVSLSIPADDRTLP